MAMNRSSPDQPPVSSAPRRSVWILPAAVTAALGAGLLTGLPEAGAATTPVQLTLPAPQGPDRIGTVSLHLVDPTRRDPWVPTHPIREIMVQLWYPATDTTHHPLAPWMTPGAAAHFQLTKNLPPTEVSLPISHAHLGAPVEPGREYPVVLYSPGSHADRSVDTTLVEELASHGYVVVAMDHTHDSDEVEFPDGHVELGTLPPDSLQVNTEAVTVREADTRLVLDTLTTITRGGNPDAEHHPLPRGIRKALNLSTIGMFGWSIGGATTAATMHDDTRIKAGIDLDGTFYGSVVTDGLARPVLLMSSQHHGRENDPTWEAVWAHLRGWKLDLRLLGAAHGSYSDAETLLHQAAPAVGIPPAQLTQQLGTIDPSNAVAAERAYITAFFDLHLRHRDTHLLDTPSPQYPQIAFLP
jgi:dienelactone hydrolase